MKMKAYGKKTWMIAEGYIPSYGNGPEPELASHETACILNTSDQDAKVKMTLFFGDCDPVGPYEIKVAARRTKHVRFNDLEQPQKIPRDTDYASLLESDVPIVVQHSRLDTRQKESALLSTLAYAE